MSSYKLSPDSEPYDFSKCNIAICTPAYGGQLTTTYTQCLIQTMDLIRSLGGNARPLFLNNESLVQRGRNTLVAQALASKPEFTHILFIDADIGWPAQSILRLLAKDVDIVGGIYPHKHYSWERLVQSQDFKRIQQELNAWKELEMMQGHKVTTGAFVQKFKSFLMKFNIVFPKNVQKIHVENGFIQVERIATGMMLIKRKVFESMKKAHPDWNYAPNTMPTKEESEALRPYNYAFFDCKIDDGQYLSEDWYFCSEWKKLGGEVWADITMPLTHCGFHVFQGMVSDTLISYSNRLSHIRDQQKASNMNSLVKSTPITTQETKDEEDPIAKLIREAEEAQKKQEETTSPKAPEDSKEEDPIAKLIREAEEAQKKASS